MAGDECRVVFKAPAAVGEIGDNMTFPSNEAETIGLFRLMQNHVGWRIVHEQVKFPDLIIENGNGTQLLAEAEYLARNFKEHGHDPQGCHLILCWHNNWPDAPLPVWALEDVVAPMTRNTNKLRKRIKFWAHENTELTKRIEILEARVNFLQILGFYQQVVGEHILPYNTARFYTNTELDLERVTRFFSILFRLPQARAIASWLQSAEIPSRYRTRRIFEEIESMEVKCD